VTEKKPLTDCQHRVFYAILFHWSEHAISPTIRELMTATGIASLNGITCNLKAIRKKGWLSVNCDHGHSRSLIPVDLCETIKAHAMLLLQGKPPESRAA